jgi:hypothetical protein
MMFQGEKPTGEETLASQFQAAYDKGILDLGASTESATKMLTDVGNGFKELLSQTNASIINIDKAMQGLINQMGRGQNLSDGIRRNLAEAVPGVIEMGGKLQDVADIAGEYTATLGRNVTLTSDQIEELFAAEKITNLQSNELIAAFSNVGMSVKDISVTMLKVREVANNLGANAIATSTEVVKNLDKLNRYGFSNGVEGLARMAAQSKTLRTDMSKVFSLADDIMDPDRAIALASSLQRLGASSEALTDPLRLMDLAQNNVPQLQTELGKMFKQFTKFNEETGQFQINKGARLQIKAIADEMGIGIAEAEKYGLSFADLSKKMSEISFSAVDIDEDTKTLVANMASIGAGGEYFIKDESGKDVKLQEFLTSYQGREEDLKKFLEVQQADEGKSYEQQMLDAQEDIAKVARMQLDAYTKTTQLGLAAEAAMPMAVAGSEFAQQMLAVNTDLSEKIYRPIIDNLGPKSDTVQAFNKAGKGLEEVVEELKKENPDFDKILTKVETTVAEVGVELAGAVGKTIKDISAPLGGLLKEMGVDIDLIIDALGVKVNEIITDIQTKYPSIESSVLEGLNKYKEQFENMLDEFEIEKQIESLIEKVKTATPTDMTQLMQMYETLKNSIPPDMVTGVQDVMTKLEDALRGGGVTLPPTIPPTGGGGVNLPPTIPNNIQVPPTIPNNIQLPPTIPNNIQLPPTIQIQSSPSLNQQPITNVEPANTNVSKEETLKLNTTSTLDGMTEALKYYSASPSLQVTIVGDKTKEINTVEGKNLSELEQTINNQNQTVTNSMIATTQDLNNLNDTIQNTTSQSSLFANESSNSVTEFFNQQTRQQSESNNFANQSINNLSESIGDQFQQVVNQNNTNNQVSTNLNNGVGVTVAEIPAPQISNQTILTPSPAAINPLEIPKAENLLQNGIMTYGGEVKISHELEIKVSSTDGKLKGDEIGKLLTAELKKDNKLVNDIKNQIGSNASFGVTSSPKAISEPQFGK